MPTLYILCGPPGCGKTSWATSVCRNTRTWAYVSRDEIRFSFIEENDDYFSKEKLVFHLFVTKIIDLLLQGYNTIADATHLNEFSRRKLTQAIDTYITDYKIVYVVFNTDVETCIERNKTREGRAYVPENVIRNMYRDFRAPSLDEDERAIDIINIKVVEVYE